ncbi:N-acetylmuramoyl-L-alanine amidase [Clostridium sp.]|uniref:N-acetylmuramoyl-L-alanine amidase n=1 Tax=Clostridium sp. TaxID=1506 RepID=UPI003217ED5B
MYKITLDPGHGGADPGAVYGNLIEKNIVLVIAQMCGEELSRHGVEVQMTRITDKYLGLSERARMANNNESDYFVSIHCNIGGGDRGEVIYSIYNGKGLELTNKISSEMMKIGQRAVKTYNKMGSRGEDYFAVIRETKMDAIIIGCAFLDNENNNIIINSMEKQKNFGTAIAKAILAQLEITYKEIVGNEI